jgi:hypothetical protein
MSGYRVLAAAARFEVATEGDHPADLGWLSLADAMAIHGHDGATRVVFAD